MGCGMSKAHAGRGKRDDTASSPADAPRPFTPIKFGTIRSTMARVPWVESEYDLVPRPTVRRVPGHAALRPERPSSPVVAPPAAETKRGPPRSRYHFVDSEDDTPGSTPPGSWRIPRAPPKDLPNPFSRKARKD